MRLVAKDGRLIASGGRLIAGTPECLARCCGLSFYRATPCAPSVGCGGGSQGEPVFIPTTFLCSDGTPPGGRTVIGFNRACYQIDGGQLYRLCEGHKPPVPPVLCVPDGAVVLDPAFRPACLSDCTAAPCLDSLPRWVTIRPCNPAVLPPGVPLPVVRADGFGSGCVVGRDGGGNCWTADCRDVFSATEDEVRDRIFGSSIDFAYRSCCECGCNSTPALLGCEDQWGYADLTPCCCPFPVLNPGTRMDWTLREVVVGQVFGYHTRETTIESGSAVINADGIVVGGGTRTHTIEYLGTACPGFPNCPPSGCVETQTSQTFREPQCPPPLYDSRPCPGVPNVTWTGSRTCSVGRSYWRYTNPNPLPPCSFGTASIERSGEFVLSGVNFGPCSGGCGPGSRLSTGDLGPIEGLL